MIRNPGWDFVNLGYSNSTSGPVKRKTTRESKLLCSEER